MSDLKISIITPTYNSEKYVEETILSVINQSYNNIQYIVIDGGSKDNTLKILDKYKDKIDTVISEKDNGMYDAINKGIKLAEGEIIAYINSDDMYTDLDVIKMVADFFEENPQIDWIYSDYYSINEKTEIMDLTRIPKVNYKEFIASNWSYIPQPTTFWRTTIINKEKAFNDEFKMAADYEFFLRLIKIHKYRKVKFIIAKFRKHQDSLSSTGQTLSVKEMKEIKKRVGYNRKYDIHKYVFYVKEKSYNLKNCFGKSVRLLISHE